ncbi:MAG: hypothetical protein LBQ32_00985 [Burkholderiaceae bacterium]|nr:hypothetical protein [Burkholderiaceae bacterium]
MSTRRFASQWRSVAVSILCQDILARWVHRTLTFGIAEVLSPLREIDKWVRRKLRCYLWKQWARSGYRELRQRGVSRRDAWNMAKSAHGPWRMSKTPALSAALPLRTSKPWDCPALRRSGN